MSLFKTSETEICSYLSNKFNIVFVTLYRQVVVPDQLFHKNPKERRKDFRDEIAMAPAINKKKFFGPSNVERIASTGPRTA